jgi:hypothetical protein
MIPYPSYPGLWAGFGLQPAAVAFALAVTLSFNPLSFETLLEVKFYRFLILYGIPVALVAPRLLLFIQPADGLINLGDTSYHVIDELLGPLTGATPYANYSPQYSGMLGWGLWPMKILGLGSDAVLGIVIVVCNLLTIAVPPLVVAISREAFPQMRRVLAICAFIALWTVCGSDLGYSTQVREFSHFARFVPALVAILLLMRAIGESQNKSGSRRFIVAGAALGFACLNNADHGLTLTAAVAAALLTALINRQLHIRSIFHCLSGFTGLLVVYLFAVITRGQSFSISSFIGLRSTAIEGDVYGGTISQIAVGPHVLVLAIPALILTEPRADRAPLMDPRQAKVDFLGKTVAVWLLLLSTKFFLFPIMPAIPALFIPAFLGGVVLLARLAPQISKESTWQSRLMAVPALSLLCLSIGAVLPTSNVNVLDELKRISGQVTDRNDWSSTPGRPADGFTIRSLRREDNFIHNVSLLRKKLRIRSEDVAYFGVFGNTTEIILDIDNVLGIAAPESLRFGQAQERLACVPVYQRMPKFIVVYASPFPCTGYTKDQQISNEHFSVYMRAPQVDQMGAPLTMDLDNLATIP